ncbi:apolipoprotein A-IV2 precursor [Takifugu rubripes]|uniref:Apolipoprotein A-IV2 n=1 Tax=Takifugu rubripes TaxID=31033 RepID=Q5KSU3_TAKRU|nr:apolipoprotein A-IV2 precursor [Takifugu rubripes]BAD83855.1 apolipoprotein A-IV2 [Takifugu rubripes]|eukprot:NP_001027891.1 apolipoprotein A-IV2 precursor [Takifugu rubripes]
MKRLVVLVLIGFTVGCDALERQPSPQVDTLRDVVLDYVSKADESLKRIRESQLGKEVNTFITGTTEAFQKLTNGLRTQVAPMAQDLVSKFSEEAERLKTRMEKDLSTGPLSSSMDPEALTTVLQQKSQDLKEQLQKNLNELQVQMVPYQEEIREKMQQSLEEFQVYMATIAQSFESQLNQKSQEIQQSLAPYGEELRARMDSDAQNLKKQLTDLWRSFTKLVQ